MSDSTTLENLRQAEPGEAAHLFREELRSRVRYAMLGLIEEEVEALCGAKYDPTNGSGFFRAGSAPSSVYFEGRKEAIKRPRVREITEQGTQEVTLKTLQAAKDPEEWEAVMMQAILCGVSCRDHQKLRPEEFRGKSPSNISRLWSRKAGALVGELNERDLSGDDPILVLMLDGIFLGNDLCAIVALGIDPKGRKHLLGFALGGSENEEVCKDLVEALKRRGLSLAATRLLCVLDGSPALRNGVLSVYPDADIQRCLIHKERNIRGYLSRKYHGKLAGYFSRLRKAQGESAAHEIMDELEVFLANKNKEALNSYHEAKGELMTVFRLNVPATLNRTLLSTNLIENAFRNLRRHLGRVNRWRGETEMAGHWIASGLTIAQKTFRRIHHYEDLAELQAALNKGVSP
jgi:putative transposase